MAETSTIIQIINLQAMQRPHAIAIMAPGRPPLTYERLKHAVDFIQRYLIKHGISRNDRVAIVLPNSPEMAVAFLGVSSIATSAPLNPAYQATEFEFYLSDLQAKALIYLSGFETPALEVAHSLNIRLIPLSLRLDEPAGVFHFLDEPFQILAATQSYPANPDDIALVLHTSGTTSRPKIVPLTQDNLYHSAENICTSLNLSPDDRCLNIMPLFHIHGLIGAVLSIIKAGASIVCTPGFDEKQFFTWLDEFQPSWFTAVPTMHHAILARAQSERDIIKRRPLRFIRSCSASLPPKLMAEIEQTFSTPVIEAYGMTEASHQIASNPLPPIPRKPGSVGIPTGPQVAVMDEAGNLLPPGSIGEVVLRGANVTRGYENNPAANLSAFTKGWFRTGDQGRLDDEGYIYLTGRLKELINRGGEKISPREVDETLLEHPAVAQAVTFAVPHPRLGEDIAVAIVLKPGVTTTENELRQYTAKYLADHKVPRRIIFVDSIPKGATGKPQRIGLADKLSHLLKAEFVPPRNIVEETLAIMWCHVLGVENVGIYDNFFDLGGDSLLLTALTARIYEQFNLEITPLEASLNPTVAEQAAFIYNKIPDSPIEESL